MAYVRHLDGSTMSYWTKRRNVAKQINQHLQDIVDHDEQIVNETLVLAVAGAETIDRELIERSVESGTPGRSDEEPCSESYPDFLIVDDIDSAGFNYSDSKSDSDSDASRLPECDPNSELPKELKHWAIKHNITHLALGELLPVLQKYHSSLPKDPRTLLSTGRLDGIKNIDGGQYYHFGIRAGIVATFMCNHSIFHSSQKFHLQVNIDGLPIFKSSNTQLWPILGLLVNLPQSHLKAEPFVIGLFSGKEKPKNPEEFLCDFVDDMSDIESNGLEYQGQLHKVFVSAIICDAPARAYVKQVKSHSGYYGCEKCTFRGVYAGKMTFPKLNAPLRTDLSFTSRLDNNHHIGPNPLSRLSNLGMVSRFPLDYMHLVACVLDERSTEISPGTTYEIAGL